MLVSLKKIIQMAEEGSYCIPAFNVYNIETVMGVIDAAEEAIGKIEVQDEVSDVVCEKCGRMMVYKQGRFAYVQ